MALLHLDEPLAHIFLSDDKINGLHHMTGHREYFSDLNVDVHSSVKFGDSSVVDIKGMSSVVLVAKAGEH